MRKICAALCFILSISVRVFAQNCVVADYPFSGNANDVSGNSFHGTATGALLTGNRFGKTNSAYNFDGIDDVIEVSHDSLFSFDTYDDFSISLWIKPGLSQATTTASSNIILSKFDDNGIFNPGGFPYSIRIYNQMHSLNGKVFALRKDSNICGKNKPLVASSTALNDSKYHHIIFTKNGSTIKLYIDNKLESSAFDNTVCSTANAFKLRFGGKGGSNNDSHFQGSIDDVIIYNCAIDSTTIDSLFNVTPWVSVNELKAKDPAIKLFPNPTTGQLILEFDNQESGEIQILNSVGTKVYGEFVTGKSSTVYLPASLQTGVYYVRYIGDRTILSKMFLLQRE